MNNVLLVGNLTRDPEVRHTPSGSVVANLRMAVNESYKDKQGEWQKNTTYIDVTAWGKVAEKSLGCDKGSRVLVVGKLRMEEWTGKDGQQKSKLGVVAHTIDIIYTEKKDAAPPRASEKAHQQWEDAGADVVDDDEPPF